MPEEPDEIQVEVEMVREVGRGLLSDGDDTLNNVRVPSLEKDEENNQEEEPDEMEPLLVQQRSSQGSSLQHQDRYISTD